MSIQRTLGRSQNEYKGYRFSQLIFKKQSSITHILFCNQISILITIRKIQHIVFLIIIARKLFYLYQVLMTTSKINAFGSKESYIEVTKACKRIAETPIQLCSLTKGFKQFVSLRYKLATSKNLHLRKILKEICKYSQINHQNNFNIHQLTKNDDYTQIMIVREVNASPNLLKVINENRRLDFSKKEIMKQLALSLHNIHEKELIHNLICLETIYLVGNSKIKLEVPYFASIHNASKDKLILFSLKNIYCAPEARINEQLSQKGDVYALGVVFLQIQLQRALQVGSSLHGQMDSIKSKYFCSLIKKMLSDNPDNRPTAQQIYYYIEQFSDDDSQVVELMKEQVSIYKRNIFKLQNQYFSLQRENSKQENEFSLQVKNASVSAKVFKDQIKFNINLILDDKNLSICIFENWATIQGKSKARINAQKIIELFKQKEIKIVIDQSGFFELLISSKKWLEIQANESKKVAVLLLNQSNKAEKLQAFQKITND